MSTVKKAMPVHLPRVPLMQSPSSPQNDFWVQQGSSGAMNAFRQLSNSLHKGGRKGSTLPGGKLKPLFRNHSNPAHDSSAGQRNILPSISGAAEGSSVLQNVVAGSGDDLPQLSPATVRIYLCSNHEDMQYERAVLQQRAVSELQEYCSTLGLGFQLVDLQWGPGIGRGESTGASQALRQQELTDCQRLSLGPNFVLLLGDKYGKPQLPQTLTVAEYEALTSLANERSLSDAALLEAAYKRDDNALPEAVFVLQIPSSDTETEKLRTVLRNAVQLAQKENKLTDDRAMELTISALADDVKHGIFNTHDPRSHCLCYHREFKGITDNLTASNYSPTYVDTLTDPDGKTILDEELQKRAQALSAQMMEHLGVGNCKNYYLTWCGTFLDQDSEYQASLDKLCQDFVKDVKDLIDLSYKQYARELTAKKSVATQLHREVLFHMNKQKNMLSDFVDDPESTLFFRVEKFLRDPRQNHKPFIIHGLSGSGKSTVIAVLGKRLKEWFSSECVVAMRFMGLTWQSHNIQKTVESITLQICSAYSLKFPSDDSFGTLYQTMVTFRAAIEQISRDFAASRPLFILLDGIDQLHPYEDCLRALWAIRSFPPNVHVVLSTTPEIAGVNILSALTAKVSSDDTCLEMPTLSEQAIEEFINTFLDRSERKLTDPQRDALMSAVRTNSKPLYIRQLMAKGVTVQSHQKVTSALPVDLSHMINNLLDDLEAELGLATVTYFACFITAAMVGIPERELIDLMTSTKDVMDEVHNNHSSSDGVFLFPSSHISRMKFVLKDFLEDHLVLGQITQAWNHREVYEIMFHRYDVIFPGIDESGITEDATNFSLALHEQFANIFLPDQKTELLCVASQRPTEQISLASPQSVSIHNAHLLHRLLPHLAVLIPVEGLARVKKTVLFNFTWIHTKLQCCPLSSVIQDTVTVTQLAKHLEQEGVFEDDNLWDELCLLLHFLQLAQPALAGDPDNLAVEVFARLPAMTASFPAFQGLVEGAQLFLETRTRSWIVPLYPCLPPPGSLLRHEFPGATHVIGLTPSSSSAILFSQQHGIRIRRLLSGELEQSFPVNSEQSLDGVFSGHMSPLVLVGHYSHLNHMMEICVWSLSSGVALVHTSLPQKYDTISMSLNDRVLYLASTAPPSDNNVGGVTQKCITGIDARSRETVCYLPCGAAHTDYVQKLMPVKGSEGEPDMLLSIGGRKSKDLALWDVEQQAIICYVKLNYYADIVKVNNTKSLVLCFNKDSGVLVVVSISQGEAIKTVEDPSIFKNMQDVYLSQSGNYAVIATLQEGVVIFSVTEGTKNRSLAKRNTGDGENIVPSAVDMDETEHVLFVGYQDGFLGLFSVIKGELLCTLASHQSTINSLYVVDSDSLLSAGEDQSAKLWNYGDAIQDFLTHNIKAPDEQFQEVPETSDSDQTTGDQEPGAALPAQATQDSSARKVYPGASENISCMTLTADGKTVVTGQADGPIKLWDVETGYLRGEYSSKCEYGVTELYTAYKGRLLIGHCVDPQSSKTRLLQVWQVDTGEAVKFEQERVAVYTSCIFPSDECILTISPSDEHNQTGIIVAIYDLFEMKCVSSLHCSIYGSMDCTNLRLLGFTTAPDPDQDTDVQSMSELDKGTDTPRVTGRSVTPPRQYVILDYFPAEGTSFFFTFVVHGPELRDISMDHHEPIHLDTLSPRCTAVLPNNLCVSGTKDGTIVIWNAPAQQILTDFCKSPVEGCHSKNARRDAKHMVWRHEGSVTCVTATEDGAFVISGGTDAKVKVWSMVDRNLVTTFSKHTGEISHISLSSPSVLCSTAKDSTMCLWDIQQQKFLSCFFIHSQATDVVMTTDNSRIIARVQQTKPTIMVLKLLNI